MRARAPGSGLGMGTAMVPRAAPVTAVQVTGTVPSHDPTNWKIWEERVLLQKTWEDEDRGCFRDAITVILPVNCN